MKNVKTTEHGWVAACPCPLHPATRGGRPLWIGQRGKSQFQLRLLCRRGCSEDEILAATGILDP
ncbi:MAG: hypothetical protein HY717_18060 [Planctomycetes bacterium]|nr:hypothetical protein [Planctomycetota bacterium]